jgi:hypothetical protein
LLNKILLFKEYQTKDGKTIKKELSPRVSGIVESVSLKILQEA